MRGGRGAGGPRVGGAGRGAGAGRGGGDGPRRGTAPRANYRLIVDNLSERTSWQVGLVCCLSSGFLKYLDTFYWSMFTVLSQKVETGLRELVPAAKGSQDTESRYSLWQLQ